MSPDERIVFVDIESIGLDPAGPVWQIAAIAVDAELRELESFESKLQVDWQGVRRWRLDGRRRPPRPLPGAEADAAGCFADFLHRHATVELSANQCTVRRVAQLAAHNATHDGPFLQAFFQRNRRFFPGSYRMLCTVQRALWLFQEDKALTPPPDFKLITLCHYFGVPLRAADAHDALHDVRATAALYRAMLSRPVRHRDSWRARVDERDAPQIL